MIDKYGIDYPESSVSFQAQKLINQIWKLIPMRENEEDWESQVDIVLQYITGWHELFIDDKNFLLLMTNLASLKEAEHFRIYRKLVFDSLNILNKYVRNDQE